MFIPDGETRTFAEMSDSEKDRHNMRRKALLALRDEPFALGQGVFMIPEPYRQEVERVDYAALQDEAALNFAFSLEALEDGQSAQQTLRSAQLRSRFSTKRTSITVVICPKPTAAASA